MLVRCTGRGEVGNLGRIGAGADEGEEGLKILSDSPRNRMIPVEQRPFVAIVEPGDARPSRANSSRMTSTGTGVVSLGNGRVTIRELAAQIGLSSPGITERIRKLEDTGAIRSYTIAVEPKIFGLGVAAHVRMHAMPGEFKRVEQMLKNTPQVVEAHHVTGPDGFVAKFVVCDVDELETVIDRFLPFASADTAIIQSSPVALRLPKL